MTLEISNTFFQTNILNENREKIITKIRGSLVDIFLEIDKEKYREFVIYYEKEKLLCTKILKVLCSMFVASILYYEKLRKDIEVIEYKVISCDICFTNKLINGK